MPEPTPYIESNAIPSPDNASAPLILAALTALSGTWTGAEVHRGYVRVEQDGAQYDVGVWIRPVPAEPALTNVSDSCSTCYPRPCVTPRRSECRRP